MNALDLHPPLYQHQHPFVTPLSSLPPSGTDPLSLDFPPLGESQDLGGFGFDIKPPSPPPSVSLIHVQGDHVIYYFENVRKVQSLFAGNTFTNATFSVSLSCVMDMS
jgi:hypothetical protein